MDTPERNHSATHKLQAQIGTPSSKFEDSPVYNFINNLSPIEPVKSAHISQTFTSLNFASPPSIFTSPQVGSHRESRFLRRHQFSDPSKSELGSENVNKALSNEGNSSQACKSTEVQDNSDSVVHRGKPNVETPVELSDSAVEQSKNFKNVSGSPDCDPISSCNTETESISGGSSTSLVPVVNVASEKGSEDNMNLKEMSQTEQKRGAGCEWGGLNCDGVDLLTFSSPGDSETIRALIQTPVDPGASLCNSIKSKYAEDNINLQKSQPFDLVSDVKHETKHNLSQPGGSSELDNVDQTQENSNRSDFNNCTGGNFTEKMDSEESYLHRGGRRRCLDFEMAGRCKNSDNSSNDTSVMQQSEEKVTSRDKQLVHVKPGAGIPGCILPGIGLHLNALAAASKDYKHTKHEAFYYRGQLKLPSSTRPLISTTDNESVSKSLALASSSERHIDMADNEVKLAVESSQTPLYLANEEFNPSSPRKKKRKAENSGETESCKRCNCKKSKCLKLYCECFAAGVYCIEPCSCQDCFNKPIHEDMVLATRKQIESRNPLAFAPKVIRGPDFASETGDEANKTPASARHKRGCNCKKSSCLKKYCECYQGGVGCSMNCRCEGCKNTFGRKDGSALIRIESETEVDTETCEKNVTEKSLQIVEVQDSSKMDPTSTVPMTPLRLHRPLAQLPFSSNSNLPRASSFIIGSSSRLYPSEKFARQDIIQPQSKLENQLQTVPEDEMPIILEEDGSTDKSVKTVSPNGKRVTPPKRSLGLSPVRRPGRKLILQSIPAFPSLNPPEL